MYLSTSLPLKIHTIYVQCRQNVLRWTIYTTSHNFDSIFIINACDGSAINAYIVLTLFYKKQTPTPDFSRIRQIYVAITIRFSSQATSLSLYFEFASLHNACCSKNSHCSRTCISQLFYCKDPIANKWRISKSLACRETTETFKMTTHLFIVQPLFHWHALVDDYWPVTIANAPDFESHPVRLF